MAQIRRVRVIKQYDLLQRERRKCGQCDKRRLCTKHLLGIENSTHLWEEWFCNECMTAQPHWSFRWL